MIYAPKLNVQKPEDIPAAIARCQQIGYPCDLRVPPLRALYQGRIGFLDTSAETSASAIKHFLGAVQKPALVIAGDDTDSPAGPDRYPALQRLIRWARQIVLHGSGGEVGHYEAAVVTAEAVRRLLFIECPSSLIDAYKAAVGRIAPGTPAFVFEPPTGQFHPDPAKRGLLH